MTTTLRNSSEPCLLPSTSTQPSASTGPRLELRCATHLRWVFPTRAVSTLRTGLTLGRDPDCDVTLPGAEISRRHAEIRIDGPVVAVFDCDSYNGLFVNGKRCRDSLLRCGDILRCGEWVAVVTAEHEPLRDFAEIAPGWFGGAKLVAAVGRVDQLPSDLPVIVQGETGTGKEGLAQALHGWSGRSGRLVAVNCAALPPQLAESELFGHRKGAFTGAEQARDGYFRAADEGTLFLDEVLEMPHQVQPKLLRAIEQREVVPLGQTRGIRVDVRLIAAAQGSLQTAVEKNVFRADLHARLDGLTIVLPPLRSRREDIVPTLFELLHRWAQGRAVPEFEPGAIEALCLYSWPKNTRELGQMAQRLLALHRSEGPVRRRDLPATIMSEPNSLDSERPPQPGGDPQDTVRPWRRTTDSDEFDALVGALRSHDGNVANAARSLGIHRARAYRLLAARPDFSLEALRTER